MNILFACDIDNTLLYSFRKKGDGYICVELNKGIEQGFMSRCTYDNFINMTEKVVFVPVTTRSVEQYKRIVFPDNYIPEYALVANGAVLIHNGIVCDDWKIIDSDIESLEEIYNRYCNDQRFRVCRIVDNSYVFVSCADDTDVLEVTRELSENTHMHIEQSFRKIYFFPDNLSKGNAVIKLKKMLVSDSVISAGDSLIDLSMLSIADTAVIPFDFDDSLLSDVNIAKSEEKSIFSDFVVKYICNLDKSFKK